jgi:hypothetical protein
LGIATVGALAALASPPAFEFLSAFWIATVAGSVGADFSGAPFGAALFFELSSFESGTGNPSVLCGNDHVRVTTGMYRA